MGQWRETYVRVFGPDGELVVVDGELGLERLDDVLVLEEEHRAMAGGEVLDLRLRRTELLRGDDLAEDVQRDVPELLVLLPKQQYSLSVNKRIGV